MRSSSTLAAYGVEDESTLRLVLRPREAIPTPPVFSVACSDTPPRVTSWYTVTIEFDGRLRGEPTEFVRASRIPRGASSDKAVAMQGRTEIISESSSSEQAQASLTIVFKPSSDPSSRLQLGDTVLVQLHHNRYQLMSGVDSLVSQWRSVDFFPFHIPVASPVALIVHFRVRPLAFPSVPLPLRLQRDSIDMLRELQEAVAALAGVAVDELESIFCGRVRLRIAGDVAVLQDGATRVVNLSLSSRLQAW